MIAASGDHAYRWAFGSVDFDEVRWELRVEGKLVVCERKPLDLLAILLRHADEVMTKDELLAGAWSGRIVVEAALTNAIGKLRKALGPDAERIVSLPRVGYRLSGPVRRRSIPLPEVGGLAAGMAVPRRPHVHLVERLGRNHASEVWRAEQSQSRHVRVFKFSLDGSRLSALKREVTLSRLLRQALGDRDEYVRLIEFDFEQPPFFTEWEFGGQGIDLWLAGAGATTTLQERLGLAAEIADALAGAHEVGVLHRDLKPANVLVHLKDKTWLPRLIDFGSGVLFDAAHLEVHGITRQGFTETEPAEDTPMYRAPELQDGHSPSIASDVYSLGVLCYQLAVADATKAPAPGWEKEIPDRLVRGLLLDCMNPEPSRRPLSARAIATRLRTLETARRRQTLRESLMVGAVAALLLLPSIGFFLAGRLASDSTHAAQQARQKAEARVIERDWEIGLLRSRARFLAHMLRGREAELKQAWVKAACHYQAATNAASSDPALAGKEVQEAVDALVRVRQATGQPATTDEAAGAAACTI